MASKIREAQEHVQAAEKCMRTTFLKWKPDHDSAADEYNQAAQCYRIGRDLRNSKICHIKAADFYEVNKSFFYAAKSLENAIIVSKEISTSEELNMLAERSSSLYQQHGAGDAAAGILSKTARIIEENAPELALKLYQRAADVSAIESGQHQAAEYVSKASRILVKLGMYDQAVDSLRREIGFHQEHDNFGAIGRLTVAIVLVQLARGDAVAAEKAYKEWGNNCEMAEMQTIEQLLAAYDDEDCDAAKAALTSPFIRHMDIEYARLALTVPLPEAIAPVQRPTVRQNAAASYVPASQENKELEDLEPQQGAAAAGPGPSAPQDDDEEELC